MAWIKTISPAEASGQLAELYRRSAGPSGQVDQILQVHSLRPYTLRGHMALYRSVLHHNDKTVPAWFLEALGVLVSRLNHCDYCAKHHAAGMERLLNDASRAVSLTAALYSDDFSAAFTPCECAALAYATILTVTPGSVQESDIQALRQAGWNDGEILEINQVCAYFAYANRTVSGLGVDIAAESLGEHPIPE